MVYVIPVFEPSKLVNTAVLSVVCAGSGLIGKLPDIGASAPVITKVYGVPDSFTGAVTVMVPSLALKQVTLVAALTVGTGATVGCTVLVYIIAAQVGLLVS